MAQAPTQADIAQHLLKVRDAQDSFMGYVNLQRPDWKHKPDFQCDLINTLDALERNILPVNNILITMPPRHSKSAISTVLFPPYFMARDPRRFSMTCSYNAQLATGFGREVRELVESPLTAQAFPDFDLSKDSRAAEAWRTQQGGAYYALGLGGTTSGRAANLLVVDDPIKSREDAESMTQRNKVWDYYTSALTTRLQPQSSGLPPCQIIILTRWHPDDLAGRIMQTSDWTEGRWLHIDLPAIRQVPKPHLTSRLRLPDGHPEKLTAEQYSRTSPTKRHVQEYDEAALWPERFSLEDLKRRERMNPRDFASLYQQQPYIEGGNLIKTNWWQTYPSDLNPEHFQTLMIGVDTAFKKTETADYSVAITAGMDLNGDIYIIDVMRGRYDFPELKQQLIRLNTRWRGKGLRGFYIEDKASGQSLIQELKRMSGMSVLPYKVTNDKVARVNSILPILEAGRVFLPETAPWLDDFVSECVAFPGGTNDDQVDALTIVLDALSKVHVAPDAWGAFADPSQSLNANPHVFGQSLAQSLGNGAPHPSASRRPASTHISGPDIDDPTVPTPKWRGWGV